VSITGITKQPYAVQAWSINSMQITLVIRTEQVWWCILSFLNLNLTFSWWLLVICVLLKVLFTAGATLLQFLFQSVWLIAVNVKALVDWHTCMSSSKCHASMAWFSILQARYHYSYRGADKSLAWPTSQCILFDGENILFNASLVIYIYIYIYMYVGWVA